MLEREVFQHFRIYPEEIMYIGEDLIIAAEGNRYLLRPINGMENTLQEKTLMGQWIQYFGDEDVATYLEPDGKKNTIHDNGINYAVFQLPSETLSRKTEKRGLGQRLASFHQAGFSYTPQDKKQMNSQLLWKERWERRVDQLESWYVTKTKDTKKSSFDKQFCETFPYFIGISENAIQLVANILIDDLSYQRVNKSICHVKFQENTWITLNEGQESTVKIPTDFTHDHYTRDLAEYIRTIWVSSENPSVREEIITSFLNEYESIQSLSQLDQKLLIARLLFPLHYFNTVEAYYRSQEGERDRLEKKCESIFSNTADYEQLFVFLIKRYPKLNHINSLPDWIIHSAHSIE
ncbi:spore coat putative kinase YutH [Evansella tamaricis]|uniref:Spore coat protein YutH n=1 Tax=Evansella tamaricis TaxID=2069301 RepID=A0ABS6JH97_9BACI|nr:spore coat protein YutH [Evansella tamaricis]MBU9713007.1 spore coat protein YutH [Evansella tamaricis]